MAESKGNIYIYGSGRMKIERDFSSGLIARSEIFVLEELHEKSVPFDLFLEASTLKTLQFRNNRSLILRRVSMRCITIKACKNKINKKSIYMRCINCQLML